MIMSGNQSDRGGRRTPSGVPGINWLVSSAGPQPAISVTLDNDQGVTLDQWRVGSAFVLYTLWLEDGLIRLPAADWDLARDDVAHGHEWTLFLELDGPDNAIVLSCADVQSRPSAVKARTGGLSGDAETDKHMAVLLCMLRQDGGSLRARASTLIGAAQVIGRGHEWRAVLGDNDGESQLFILSEPNGPPPPLP